MQCQLATEGFFQIAVVAGGQRVCLFAVYHHYRWILAACVRVTEFHPAAVDYRRRMTRYRVLEDSREPGRG